MAPKACTPAYFGAFLARSWAEGTTKVRHPFSDIRYRDYTGSYSHLAPPRYVAQQLTLGECGGAAFPGPRSPCTAARANAGPDDGPSDLATDRGGTLREASWLAR
jgi:hypothetical protein